MENWLDFPWLEAFVVNSFLIGIIASLIFLLSKSPSGRWLGVVFLSLQGAILLQILNLTAYLPSGISLIVIVSFYYFKAFFYQKTRNSFIHFLAPLVVASLGYFLNTNHMLIWLVGGMVIIGYSYTSVSFLLQEGETRGFSYFQDTNHRISWLRNHIILVAIFIITLLFSSSGWMLSLSFLVVLGHTVHQTFQESSFLSPFPIGNKYKKSSLTPEIKAAVIDKLEEVMVANHFYRQDDASLGKLADLLGVTNHHLSQVLNESMKISFQDLLARFRIREACKLLREESNEQVKIESVANMVGYNSKSSFNTAFKKRTGLTPSEYRNAKNVRDYGEERLSERKTPLIESGERSLNRLFNIKLNRTMIRITFRNLRKHKLQSALNIVGLAIGISACLTIAAYVHYELSYDKHYPEAENVYRIALNRIYPDSNKEWAVTAPVLAPRITEQLPEVEHYTRLTWDDYMFARAGEKLDKQRIVSVDSGFFQVFAPKILSGVVTNDFFKRNDGIVLTQTASEKYFGEENPIGKLFNIQLPSGDEKMVLRVEAVVEDPPSNAHFTYEILATLEVLKFPDFILNSWGTWAVYSYIRVHPETDTENLTEKINAISIENQSVGDDDFQAWLDAGNLYDYFLQPVTDIHLNSNLNEEYEANSSKAYVYFFALVGVFILLMAVVNFVNLATARASYRTMEVGIRKAVGAGRRDLIAQFLTESTLICFIAMVIAFPLAQVFMPYFNQTVGKSISFEAFSSPSAIMLLIAAPFFLGILSGFYPALYLSNFSPAAVFQKLLVRKGKEGLRHFLVIGQLLIAVLLIAGTITVFRQMHYLTNKPLGFDKDQLIKVDLLPLAPEKIDVFREEAIKVDGVSDVAISTFPLDKIRSGSSIHTLDNPEGWVNMTHYDVDEHFVETLGIQLVAGRDLIAQDGTDNEEADFKIILNAAAAEALGWSPEEAIDQRVGNSADLANPWTIVGVVEDFNFSSLHRPVGYFILSHEGAAGNIPFRSVTIRFEPRKMKETLAGLEEVWADFVPDQVFDYSFVDEAMAHYYEAERLTGKLFVVFSSLGIFICCLGLFGLMGFVVEKRAKEVGIRKVMGARIRHIVLLLSKDYVRLVLIASLIAIPIAWWGLNQWLDSFAYRIDNSIWTFIGAGLLVAVVSWLTVAFYSYQAAKTNPVNSLRSE